jgi:hypothetical protein
MTPKSNCKFGLRDCGSRYFFLFLKDSTCTKLFLHVFSVIFCSFSLSIRLLTSIGLVRKELSVFTNEKKVNFHADRLFR